MNRFNFSAILFLAIAILTGVPRIAQAAESYDNCTGFITSLPAVISTQGTWCMKQDLATSMSSGAAITIATNNVTIDCNDFKLGGLAAGVATQAYGIAANNRLNAKVRNCNIRGFWYGIFLYGFDSAGHLIENNRLDANTLVGISVYGDGSVIRDNRVLDTGGSPVIPGATGIEILGSVDVLDNTISGVAAIVGGGGNVVGIISQLNPGSSISGNRVRGLAKDGAGQAWGIKSTSDPSRLTLRGNEVVGDSSAGSVGLLCTVANDHARDNVINGFATGISNCGDDGGNVIAP